MSKKIYIVVEKSYFYNDEYYTEADGGMPEKAFETRQEAEAAALELDITICFTGHYRLWETEECFDNPDRINELTAALQRVTGREFTEDQIWEIDDEFVAENLNRDQVRTLLTELNMSYHRIVEKELEDVDSEVSISDWYFVVEAVDYMEEGANGEVIGAYPFKEVAERVVEEWWADNRFKKLAELASDSRPIDQPFYAEFIATQISGDFSYEGKLSECDLSTLTQQQFTELLQLSGAKYLKVVAQ